jgi:D-cysteine desulfhydrase
MAEFQYPERLSLARLPTPVQRMDRLSEELGVNLLVKRDDLTGMELSGNKIRKLEFVLADALARNSTAVITTGGLQSNHCRATALAAVGLGLRPHLLLHTPDGEAPAEPDGNHLLDLLVGADIRYLPTEEYSDVEAHLARWALELVATGERPFAIPSGASTPMGALGYVAMVEELLAQHQGGDLPGGRLPDYIAHACGSGGTAAGLALGARVFGLDAKVVSYAVCDDVEYFLQKIDRIIAGAAQRFEGLPGARDVSYEVVDEFKGVGYALSTPQELDFLRDLARADGLILDPVYSGKAFGGLVEELRRKERYLAGSTVLFVHTGGLFGLFPKRNELSL